LVHLEPLNQLGLSILDASLGARLVHGHYSVFLRLYYVPLVWLLLWDRFKRNPVVGLLSLGERKLLNPLPAAGGYHGFVEVGLAVREVLRVGSRKIAALILSGRKGPLGLFGGVEANVEGRGAQGKLRLRRQLRLCHLFVLVRIRVRLLLTVVP